MAFERFWKLVERSKGCWGWVGASNRKGYGVYSIGEKHWKAHRLSYTLTVGPIPNGMTLDHLCRNRLCVNPSHLEPVSNRENILRGVSFSAINASKTHCAKGHPYNEKNTYIRSNGHRGCRVCKAQWMRDAKTNRKEHSYEPSRL